HRQSGTRTEDNIPHVSGTFWLLPTVKEPELSLVLMSLTRNSSTVPLAIVVPKISPIVRVANMSVGGAELPRPAEASAGKSWWKPKLKLPIKSAAYGKPGRGAPGSAGPVCPGLFPVLVTGGAV